MSNDPLQIIANTSTKKIVRVIGSPLIKNTYDLTIVNIGDSTPADLLLQIKIGSDLYANILVGGFSASGSNAVGVLDLNQTPLVNLFSGRGATASQKFDIVVQDTVDEDSVFVDTIVLANNPVSSTATPPGTPGQAVTVDGATVINEIPVWKTVDGELNNAGIEVEAALSGDVDKIPWSSAIKTVTDALASSILGLSNTIATTLKRTAGDFANGISSKVTPVNADRVLIEDSADGYSKKNTTVGFLKALPGTVNAANVNTDTSNFNNNLSSADTDAQKALETLDDLDVSGIAANTTHRGLTNNPHSTSKTHVGLSNVVNTLNKFDATVAPTVNEDSGDGYGVGSQWVDVTADATYFCQDATVGAAVWVQLGSGSGALEDVMSLYA